MFNTAAPPAPIFAAPVFAQPSALENVGGLVDSRGARLAPVPQPKLPPRLRIDRDESGNVVVSGGQGERTFSFSMDAQNSLQVISSLMVAAGVRSMVDVELMPNGSVRMGYTMASAPPADEPAAEATE